jgi:hypothetical protein
VGSEQVKGEKMPHIPSTASRNRSSGAGIAGKGAEKSTSTSKAIVTSVQDTQRVVDYRIGVWRKALKKELFADPHKNLCMLIGIMMTRGGTNVSSTKLASGFETMTSQKPPSVMSAKLL